MGESLQMAASAKGTFAVLVGDKGSINVVDLASGRLRAIDSQASSCRTPAISPNGKEVAVACSTGNGVYEIRIFDVEKGTFRSIPATRADLRPAWSPGGDQILFVRASKIQTDGVGLPASNFSIWRFDVASHTTAPLCKQTFTDVTGFAVSGSNVAIAGRTKESNEPRVLQYSRGTGSLSKAWERGLNVGCLRYDQNGNLLAAFDPAGDFSFEVCRISKGKPVVSLTHLKTYIESFDPVGKELIILDSPSRDVKYRLLRVAGDGSVKRIEIRR